MIGYGPAEGEGTMVPLHYPAMVRANRQAFSRRSALREFSRATGWLDLGEKHATAQFAEEFRGQSVLDLGVGGGRTTELLSAIAGDYVGVDYVEPMVAAAAARHPGARFLCADARDLSMFADASFQLVNMSNNMIDAVDPQGRLQVLREAHRVLRPGGLLIFSALNRDGPGHDEGFHMHSQATGLLAPLHRLRWAAISLRNRMRLGRLALRGADLSAVNIAALGFAVVALFITRAAQLRQLRDVGFVPLAEWGNTGRLLPADDLAVDSTWIHYVARKPG
jgi:SAM-dependent methyltransferase